MFVFNLTYNFKYMEYTLKTKLVLKCVRAALSLWKSRFTHGVLCCITTHLEFAALICEQLGSYPHVPCDHFQRHNSFSLKTGTEKRLFARGKFNI